MAFFSRPQSASAAVKIVRPASEDDKLKQVARKDSTQRQCRNILIYGSCKFQDKGCVYYHPPATDGTSISASASAPVPPYASSSPRSESPAPAALPAQAVNAPVFVPKTAGAIAAASSPPLQSPQPASGVTTPTNTSPLAAEYQDQELDPYDPYSYPPSTGLDGLGAQMHRLDINMYDAQSDTSQSMYSSEYGHGDYFLQPPTYTHQPLHYHLYTKHIPSSFSPTPFMSSDLRETLTKRSEALRLVPQYYANLNLPDELQGYHTLVPLENLQGERRKFGNWYSVVYRATNTTDGGAYALRRVENYRLVHKAAFNAIEAWARIRHPSIVGVREAFTTHDFSDNSLVVAYDYHANAVTLFDAHLNPATTTVHGLHGPKAPSSLPERTIWTYLVQLASAIKTVHEAGLAVRVLDATKILVTGENRLRISSCGIVDVLTYVPPPSPSHQEVLVLQFQQEDLVMLGRLVFALATLNLAAPTNLSKALETMMRLYSPELKNVALWLIGVSGAGSNGKSGPKTIGQLFEMISPRVVGEMNDALTTVDNLELQLTSELENARLVRLLCKFGFINERPEFAREPRWSETGDRYIIKLFRDYVFHQVDEQGNPVVNLSYVLTCLSKLDVGTDERIMLVSRDEQSCLVVSYKEVKNCIQSAFLELARASTSSTR